MSLKLYSPQINDSISGNPDRMIYPYVDTAVKVIPSGNLSSNKEIRKEFQKINFDYVSLPESLINTNDTAVVDSIPVDTAFSIDWINFPFYHDIRVKKDTVITDNFRTETVLEPHPGIHIKENYSFITDWMTIAIVILLFVAGWIRFNFPKQLSQIFKSFFSFRQSARLFVEQNSLQQTISNVLDLYYILVTSVFVSQLLNFFEISFLGLNHIYSSLTVSVIYLAVIYFKVLLYSTLGYLFDRNNLASEFIHNAFVVNKVLALSVLPVLIAVPFVPDEITIYFIYLGIALYGIFYLFKILRGLQIIIIRNQSIYYAFLYICILEIVPILIILKMISSS